MDPLPAKRRLARQDRHIQLMAAALEIVRSEGVAAVTLAKVAEKAGVTKPVAYDHFLTIDGLLVALYKMLDREQGDALRRALADEPHDLTTAAERIAATYMHCCADTSGEWHAIAGALRGSPDMETAHRELADAYVSLFVAGLGPHSRLPADELRSRCIALTGAAEALALQMIRGSMTESAAAKTLAAMTVASLNVK